ncbi:MAG: glycosyltransferase [Owenweeksia sp.]|nr:glycosyltransferase [Owenweeksia sp.]
MRLYFANSVSVLPIGAFFSGKRGGRLIYAPHELESQRNSVGLVGRYISRLIENIFIRRAHKVVVVGEKIGDWYINEYTLKQRPVVLRNIPNRNYFKLRLKSEGEDYLRDKFQIPQDKIICLYQGIFTKGRGLENIIQVATDNAIQERFVFIFLGFGPYENYIRKAVKVHNNIYFHEAVDFNRLQLLTASADLGLCLIENTCLSYYYSLPNKLFEYIRSGLPVLGSDFPEIEKFILNGGFGWITNPTAEGIRSILYELDNDVIRSKKNSMEVSELNLCWEDDFARMWYMLSPN